MSRVLMRFDPSPRLVLQNLWAGARLRGSSRHPPRLMGMRWSDVGDQGSRWCASQWMARWQIQHGSPLARDFARVSPVTLRARRCPRFIRAQPQLQRVLG